MIRWSDIFPSRPRWHRRRRGESRNARKARVRNLVAYAREQRLYGPVMQATAAFISAKLREPSVRNLMFPAVKIETLRMNCTCPQCQQDVLQCSCPASPALFARAD